MNLPLLEPCENLFPSEEFGNTSQLIDELGQGSDPIALLLTCWELGGAPEEISTANPGEVMIVQNPGGLISSRQLENAGTQWASIIYGLSFSTVRHLIVCGHTECKTLGLLLASENQRQENPFRKLMEPIDERFHSTYRSRPLREQLSIFVQLSILQQLETLHSDPHIRNRLQQDQLLLHGWLLDDQSARIAAFNPVVGQFQD